MTKAERLAKQFTNLGIDDFREFQRILEERGFLVGMTIVSDSWMREHAPKQETINKIPGTEKKMPAE